jgi:hypothetical protein
MGLLAEDCALLAPHAMKYQWRRESSPGKIMSANIMSANPRLYHARPGHKQRDGIYLGRQVLPNGLVVQAVLDIAGDAYTPTTVAG